MAQNNAQTKLDPFHDLPTPEEEARQRVLEEVAEEARREPERWLRDAEVPKGGE